MLNFQLKKIIVALQLCGAIHNFSLWIFFFVCCLLPFVYVSTWKNRRKNVSRSCKNEETCKLYSSVWVFFTLLKLHTHEKYGVVSLGMGFDKLTACSWCGAMWVKWQPNHVLKHEDQSTTLVKVTPSEVSLLRSKGEVTACSFHLRAMTNIHFTKSTFDENRSYCVYLVSETHNGRTIKTNWTKAKCKQFWVKYHSYLQHGIL